MPGENTKSIVLPHDLRMIAWEVTRRCNLNCVHCRAGSANVDYQGELTTKECRAVIDDVVSFSNPVIILTGGEPYMRDDIYKLAAYGTERGLRMVLATNGTLVDDACAVRTREAGIQRVSVSIDGRDATSHDTFRGVPGAFDGAIRGIEAFKRQGVPFQINTTITRKNYAETADILDLAMRLGAVACHIFLLVPTGRARDMASEEISPEKYEKVLEWFYERGRDCPVELKATCAPHYTRIVRQHGTQGGAAKAQTFAGGGRRQGCLGGVSFCFISHTGRVQPCGFLDLECGSIKRQPLSVVWPQSPVFARLRDCSLYKGKCGRCEYRVICGGCRARAYEATGDYMAEEPYCLYEPRAARMAGETDMMEGPGNDG